MDSVNREYGPCRKASLKKACLSLDLNDEEELARQREEGMGGKKGQSSRQELHALSSREPGAWRGEGRKKRAKNHVALSPHHFPINVT